MFQTLGQMAELPAYHIKADMVARFSLQPFSPYLLQGPPWLAYPTPYSTLLWSRELECSSLYNPTILVVHFFLYLWLAADLVPLSPFSCLLSLSPHGPAQDHGQSGLLQRSCLWLCSPTYLQQTSSTIPWNSHTSIPFLLISLFHSSSYLIVTVLVKKNRHHTQDKVVTKGINVELFWFSSFL